MSMLRLVQNVAKQYAGQLKKYPSEIEHIGTKHFAPYAKEWDKKKVFPREEIQKLAPYGLGGMHVPVEYGGINLTRVEGALVYESLARSCVSTTAYLALHNMAAWVISKYGAATLKDKLLHKLTSLKICGCYCLTEPGSGSDAGSLTTSAKLVGDHYVLNGSKSFISGGGQADVYIVFARSSTDEISCFCVEKTAEGISFGKQEHKMGWNSNPTSVVNFDNCKIPKDHLIGGPGQGFFIALNALVSTRINMGMIALGGVSSCIDEVLPKLDTPELKVLSDNIAKIFNAYLLALNAASKIDAQEPTMGLYSSMSKRYASDTAFKAIDDVIEVMGINGLLNSYNAERNFRDIRVHQILGGTNEIMRLIIAKELLK